MGWEEVDRFDTISEDGTVYTVIDLVEVDDFRPLSGAASRLEGPRRYALLDGSHVNPIDAKTLKIFDTDEIIRKID
jgi:hypothetical protein